MKGWRKRRELIAAIQTRSELAEGRMSLQLSPNLPALERL